MRTARREHPRADCRRFGLVLCIIALWLQVLQPLLAWHGHGGESARDHGGHTALCTAGARDVRDRAPAGPSGRIEQAEQHDCGLCIALQLARTGAAPEPSKAAVARSGPGRNLIEPTGTRAVAVRDLPPPSRAPPQPS